MPQSFRVRPGASLRGQVRVPADKSIGHRALMFAALADGRSTLRGFVPGGDQRSTIACLRALGVGIEVGNDGQATDASIGVEGVGIDGLRMPSTALDCGNSGTTMRLLAGLLSGQRFGSSLVGDASLHRRPMGRVIEPLRARGAQIAGSSGPKASDLYPPIRIAPLVDGERLSGLEYDMPIASAQVKSALLLSGLYAEGITAVREPVLSRDHTERMLLALGVPLQTAASMVVLDPSGWDRRWASFDWEIPGDISSAAFLHVAALLIPGSDLTLSGVGINPTRTGFLDALRHMGDVVEVTPLGAPAGGEPLGDLRVRSASLRGAKVAGELLVRMIDEVPAMCVVAAVARGITEIRDAAELRVKESDRIATMAATLRAFGAACEELPDGLRIEGSAQLRGATVASHGDHRVAMAAVLLGLVAAGETIVEDTECVDISFPGFAALLRSVGADVEER